ncbi:vacuolar protein-sorting-associated protein 36-like [Hylaeus anthracinus]|uniref:vacuolar protein-sorting-associated protein 36-like n=1 Tax=Hylaeus anthracinus TaxID=313031 RepID=UPI0023BA34FE|nr:vacuolar protein-sorting-associated protein 36-like [Hylaeus anthracinus]XP_054009085.1 vacuolar protein-sorting-associated protein 36-like [Hylaeus anthracinus]
MYAAEGGAQQQQQQRQQEQVLLALQQLQAQQIDFQRRFQTQQQQPQQQQRKAENMVVKNMELLRRSRQSSAPITLPREALHPRHENYPRRAPLTNLKPAGLLQTPVLQQRFEVVAMDLFGPLPPGPQNEKWVFIVEDYATRWTALFALDNATKENCA